MEWIDNKWQFNDSSLSSSLPSLSNLYESNTLELKYDNLPQPYLLINKIIENLLTNVYEYIDNKRNNDNINDNDEIYMSKKQIVLANNIEKFDNICKLNFINDLYIMILYNNNIFNIYNKYTLQLEYKLDLSIIDDEINQLNVLINNNILYITYKTMIYQIYLNKINKFEDENFEINTLNKIQIIIQEDNIIDSIQLYKDILYITFINHFKIYKLIDNNKATLLIDEILDIDINKKCYLYIINMNKIIIYYSNSHIFYLYNIQLQKIISQYIWISSITCSQKNQHYIAFGYNNGHLIIYNLNSLKIDTILQSHKVSIKYILWNNNNYLISINKNNLMYIFHINNLSNHDQPFTLNNINNLLTKSLIYPKLNTYQFHTFINYYILHHINIILFIYNQQIYIMDLLSCKIFAKLQLIKNIKHIKDIYIIEINDDLTIYIITNTNIIIYKNIINYLFPNLKSNLNDDHENLLTIFQYLKHNERYKINDTYYIKPYITNKDKNKSHNNDLNDLNYIFKQHINKINKSQKKRYQNIKNHQDNIRNYFLHLQSNIEQQQ